MIVGIGVDLVDVERFKWMMRRSPNLVSRVFSERESQTPEGIARSAESLAARFAAKEAVVKALGEVASLRPQQCEVVVGERGKPFLELTGELAQLAEDRGVTTWHLSLAHDGGNAIAYVIAECRPE